MRNPRDFTKPLAIGAPEPPSAIPVTPSRMIHFLDFSNEKMVAKAPDIATQTDVLLGNLEDAVPVDRKLAARAGLIRVGREMDLGTTALWTRVNALESPWVLDDITEVVGEIGDKLSVVMVRRSRARGTSTTSTASWPNWRPRRGSTTRSSSTPSSRRRSA